MPDTNHERDERVPTNPDAPERIWIDNTHLLAKQEDGLLLYVSKTESGESLGIRCSVEYVRADLLDSQAAGDATWSKESPKVDGVYWWRADRADFEPDIHSVVNGRFYEIGESFSREVEGFGGEWLGPITPTSSVNTATAMRDRCVARVKEYLRHAKNIDIAPLIDDLKS